MKKIIVSFVFVLLLGLVFNSCSSDDSSSTPTSTSVVGKWNFSKVSYTFNGQSSPEADYDGNEQGCSKDYIEFKANGVYNEADYSSTACVEELSVGTWSKEGSLLTITDDTDTVSVEIIGVTTSTLKVKFSEGTNSATVTFTKG
ncbi:MAG: hypothetical protein ACJAX7_002377 [Saprospiraceae bacterium]|jgi:hypothetical protein